ncbi:MAG: ribose-phosphate pyrophosphokinase [Archangium sp.]|nr:ribose-phosphate pyrophosphokinase [Archangium sp.]
MRTVLLSGSSHPALTQALAAELKVSLGACTVGRYPDGECDIDVAEDVREADVFVVQALHAPVGEYLLELTLLTDACLRAGAARVTAVIPYLGYARHDRRESGTEPLGARVVAELLAAARVHRLVCIDLHSRAVEGCFPQPVEHTSMVPALVEHLRAHVPEKSVVVSPDLGAVKRAEAFARPLGLPVAVVHKQRLSGDSVQTHGVVGDVAGRHPIIVDDMISTGGTLVAAVQAVIAAGAVGPVTVVASHGLFVGNAEARLAALPLARVVVSDSVPGAKSHRFPLERVSCAPVLASVIRRIQRSER